MKPNEIPILIIGFNRPKLIEDLILALSVIKPLKIYFAVDGPRKENSKDLELTNSVKEKVQLINWECNVQTLFRKENVGLKISVIESLDWIFSVEETAIILEDDCHPIPEFFSFCAETLTRYSGEEKVMQISGNSFVEISEINANRYYFSTLNDIWGWATWRRAWEKFEREVPNAANIELQNRLHKYFQNKEIERWFIRYVREASSTKSQVWSTQWTLTLINNCGYTLVPQTNLVANVGFTSDATHLTSRSFNRYSKFKPKRIESNQIPDDIFINKALDLKRFTLIKATDLNLRKKNLLLASIRDNLLNWYPISLVKLILRFKNNKGH